jgi:hypothetical protein
MSSSAELSTPLELGSYVAEIILPSFMASVSGQPAVVRLDRAAMFKLAEDAEHEALASLLNFQRPRIREAAQRLFDQGSFRELGGDVEILVTAQDLD